MPKQWTFPYRNGSERGVKPIPQLLRAFFLISYKVLFDLFLPKASNIGFDVRRCGGEAMTGLEKQSIASPTKFPTKSTLSMQRICVMLWFPIRGTVCDDSPIPHYPRQVSREAECVPTMLLSSPQCDLLTLHNVTLELHVAVLRFALRYFSIAVLHRSALLFCSARWTLRVQCCERPRAPAD